MSTQDTTQEAVPPSKYPKVFYNRKGETMEVQDEHAEADLDPNDWRDSPAKWGIETQPARRGPDPEIAKTKRELNSPPAAKK